MYSFEKYVFDLKTALLHFSTENSDQSGGAPSRSCVFVVVTSVDIILILLLFFGLDMRNRQWGEKSWGKLKCENCVATKARQIGKNYCAELFLGYSRIFFIFPQYLPKLKH